MNRLKVLLLAVSVALMAPLAYAGTISGDPGDPVVKTGGSPPVGLPDVPAGIVSFDFSIESPSGNSPATSPCDLIQGNIRTVSPQCFFQNDISVNGVGQTLTMLTFDALGVNPNTVSCGFLSGSPFTQCGVDPLSNNAGSEISFFGGSIPFGTNFTLDFAGFPTDYTFGGTASTPDPGTLSLMMLGGLATLLVRRRILAR
jgi:hypothetical protein